MRIYYGILHLGYFQGSNGITELKEAIYFLITMEKRT